MSRLTPDPSFYATATEAAAAAPEQLAYVATIGVGQNGDTPPDALGVLDLDASSPSYGEIVGRVEMPNVGDELHHFGWNACSSALCPWMPHPHVERRYLVVPGLRSSRVYVLDTEATTRAARGSSRRSSRRRSRSRTGYSRAHTVHCGPDGIYVNALGNPDGDGPGGIFVLDHDTFEVKGAWERDRGPQELAYDFWWHLGYDRVITSEWGTPNMVEDGVNPELLLGNKYGHRLHVWDMKRRRHLQEIDLGAEHQMIARAAARARPRQGVRLRGLRGLDGGPVGLGVPLGALRRRQLRGREGDLDPGRAGG